MNKVIGGLAVGGLGLIVACATVDMPEPVEGQLLFEQNCAVCHGTGSAFETSQYHKPGPLTD